MPEITARRSLEDVPPLHRLLALTVVVVLALLALVACAGPPAVVG